MSYTTRRGYAAAAPAGYTAPPDPGGPPWPLSIPGSYLREWSAEPLDTPPTCDSIAISNPHQGG